LENRIVPSEKCQRHPCNPRFSLLFAVFCAATQKHPCYPRLPAGAGYPWFRLSDYQMGLQIIILGDNSPPLAATGKISSSIPNNEVKRLTISNGKSQSEKI